MQIFIRVVFGTLLYNKSGLGQCFLLSKFQKKTQKITIDNIARSSQNLLRAITTAKILQCNKKNKKIQIYTHHVIHIV